MSKFYIGVDKEEPITEIVWRNVDNYDESVEICNEKRYLTINDENDDSCSLHIESIPKLEAALAKARDLGWFE